MCTSVWCEAWQSARTEARKGRCAKTSAQCLIATPACPLLLRCPHYPQLNTVIKKKNEN